MLINLRNALMAGKRLPYDAELEFLESTGTQYVDTLVNADSNLSVEITMANAGSPWTNVNPMGAILVVSTSLQTRHHLNFSATGVNYYYGNINDVNVKTLYKPNDLVPFTFKVDSVNKIFTLGDYSTALPTYAFDAGLSYWLFGRNGTTPPYLGSLRIYSAKLWNGSVLVRDFIPVRVGTVGYLYDRVSGKLFGNAGTGDFVLGPDVVPVEYIESHGTEWIDTGVVPNDNMGFTVDTMAIGAVANLRILGVYETISGVQQRFAAVVRSGGRSVDPREFYFGWGAAYSFTASETNFMTRRVMGLNFLNSRSMTFDGVVVSSNLPTLATFTTSAWLFRNRGTTDLAAQRIYRCQMSSGNEILRSFLPIRVGTNATSWEGAMMDVLTRRIYRNQGTGAFGYGNDLKYPIPAS